MRGKIYVLFLMFMMNLLIQNNHQFYLADWCKINPVIINMYEEVI